MIRNLYSRLGKLPRNQRGTSLVAYAVLLGGIAVALAGGLVDFSDGVSTALTNEANNIATLAGTSTSSSPSTTSPSTPTTGSPTTGTPTTSSPTSGKGKGRKGKK